MARASCPSPQSARRQAPALSSPHGPGRNRDRRTVRTSGGCRRIDTAASRHARARRAPACAAPRLADARCARDRHRACRGRPRRLVRPWGGTVGAEHRRGHRGVAVARRARRLDCHPVLVQGLGWPDRAGRDRIRRRSPGARRPRARARGQRVPSLARPRGLGDSAPGRVVRRRGVRRAARAASPVRHARRGHARAHR